MTVISNKQCTNLCSKYVFSDCFRITIFTSTNNTPNLSVTTYNLMDTAYFDHEIVPINKSGDIISKT